MGGPNEPPNLAALPLDALSSVLSWLDLRDCCRAARVSCSLRAAARDDCLWAALGVTYGESVHCDYSDPSGPIGRARFRERWCGAMAMVESVDKLGDGTGGRQKPQECLAVTAGTALVMCCAPSAWKASVDGQSVGGDEFLAGVAGILTHLATGVLHPLHLVDWLRCTASERQPLRCLAILAALQDKQAWLPSGCDLKKGKEARAMARRRLAASPAPPAALLRKISVRWLTWSQRRDCRGFRARDDVHQQSETLLELWRRPDNHVWNVLARGVANDVRDIRVVSVLE